MRECLCDSMCHSFSGTQCQVRRRRDIRRSLRRIGDNSGYGMERDSRGAGDQLS